MVGAQTVVSEYGDAGKPGAMKGAAIVSEREQTALQQGRTSHRHRGFRQMMAVRTG